MANLRDANGTIVINSAEAQADIKNLTRAMNTLSKAKENIKKEKSKLDSSWEGRAKNAFDRKYNEINKEIDAMIERINVSIKAIQDVVAHYERVDRELKARIKAETAEMAKISFR